MAGFYFALIFNGEFMFGFYSKTHAEENKSTIFGFGSPRR